MTKITKQEEQMKTINVSFTEEEYEQLVIAKRGKSLKDEKNWHDFIMQLVDKK